jgi:hypothetical protein
MRVARGQIGRDGIQQPLGRDRDLIHRPLERRLVPASGFVEPAHLAHELARRGADLIIGGNDVGVTQSFDASTHATTIASQLRFLTS